MLLRWVLCLRLQCIELSELDSLTSLFTQTASSLCFLGPTGLIRRSSQTKQLPALRIQYKQMCKHKHRLFHCITLIGLDWVVFQLLTRHFLGMAMIDLGLCCIHPQLAKIFLIGSSFGRVYKETSKSM